MNYLRTLSIGTEMSQPRISKSTIYKLISLSTPCSQFPIALSTSITAYSMRTIKTHCIIHCISSRSHTMWYWHRGCVSTPSKRGGKVTQASERGLFLITIR